MFEAEEYSLDAWLMKCDELESTKKRVSDTERDIFIVECTLFIAGDGRLSTGSRCEHGYT